MTKDRDVVLSDARAIRALAHPARLAVIEELSSGEELTATECAEVVGLSPSAMSYHLRSLERAGIVERAPSKGDGRERPWRAVGRAVRVDAQALPGGGAAVMGSLVETIVGRVVEDYTTWISRQGEEGRAWRSASALMSMQLWLRADELEQLEASVRELTDRVRDRVADDRPADSRRVRVALFGFPIDRRGGAGDTK